MMREWDGRRSSGRIETARILETYWGSATVADPAKSNK